MKGIPVRPNGDPVRRTYVIAQTHSQFRNWCRYSRVNPDSGLATAITDATYSVRLFRGIRECDFVFTGLWHMIDRGHVISDYIVRIEANPHYTGQRYYQVDSCEIEPDVIDDSPGLRRGGGARVGDDHHAVRCAENTIAGSGDAEVHVDPAMPEARVDLAEDTPGLL